MTVFVFTRSAAFDCAGVFVASDFEVIVRAENAGGELCISRFRNRHVGRRRRSVTRFGGCNLNFVKPSLYIVQRWAAALSSFRVPAATMSIVAFLFVRVMTAMWFSKKMTC